MLLHPDIQIVCTEFDITDDHQASYEITISEERINGTLLNNNFTVKLALSSNWISSDAFKSSSSRTISMNSSSSHKQSTTISNLEIFANRTNYLLPFPKPCLYVLVTYTVTDRGNSTEHNDIISYEYGTYERVGSSETRHADVRIVSATNAALKKLAKAGKFKEDLLDRLSFEVLFVPPLRERREDIMLLANHFAARMATECRMTELPFFSPEAERKLLSYSWPGNIRELKNTVERAVYRSTKQEIDEIIFDPFQNPFSPLEKGDSESVLSVYDLSDYPVIHDEIDVLFMQEALRESKGNQRKASEKLGITYDQFRGVYRKLKSRISLDDIQ